MIAAGSIRASLPDGALTRRAILTALPFPTNIVQFELNGSALERYLIAVHGMTPGSGAFALSNGLSWRAGRQQIGVPLDPLKTYRVATSAIAAGDTGCAWPTA